MYVFSTAHTHIHTRVDHLTLNRKILRLNLLLRSWMASLAVNMSSQDRKMAVSLLRLTIKTGLSLKRYVTTDSTTNLQPYGPGKYCVPDFA